MLFPGFAGRGSRMLSSSLARAIKLYEMLAKIFHWAAGLLFDPGSQDVGAEYSLGKLALFLFLFLLLTCNF